MERGHTEDFHIDESGTLQFHNQFYVPTNTEIREEILKEVYCILFILAAEKSLRPQGTLLVGWNERYWKIYIPVPHSSTGKDRASSSNRKITEPTNPFLEDRQHYYA